MDRKHEILRDVFGYTTFRSGQEALIDAQLSGRDVLGIMPTGGGKSLCYQIPALIMDGVTLVVSPLISLMQDQVMALKNSGVAAAYVNSSLTPGQIRLVYRNMRAGRYRIVYVAPERLTAEEFLETARSIDIAMLTVDEAHCVSQWGQDFRPSYLRIPEFLSRLDRRPVVSAFTATATEDVRRDVARQLGLHDPFELVTGFDRPNLRFEVLKPEHKSDALVKLISERADKCGIVYCSTRKDVEKVCELLCARGYPATRYHAGLSDEERRANQEDFVYDRRSVMVATNAFGMGIDKSNVGYVIHYNMPQSLEAYYQEAGRAGRDGADADCILLFAYGDVMTARFLIEHPSENELLSDEERARVMALDLSRLEKMIAYCNTDRCLRGFILDYFGQEHPETCGNCGNCDGDLVTIDVSEHAGTVITCIVEIKRKLDYYLGAATVVKILRGSSEKRIRSLGLDALPSYGRLRALSPNEMRSIVVALENTGALHTDPVHGGIYPTKAARGVLSGETPVTVRAPKPVETAGPQRPKKVAAAPDPGLLAELKALRLLIAKRSHLPAYMIFSNATLEDMAAKAPRDHARFLDVNGVGNHKAALYAETFLKCINNYLDR